MTISSPNRRAYSLRLKASRDWPLAGAAISALVSFGMLFPPWLTRGNASENAFGEDLQSAGPALIVVTAFATVVLIGVAIVLADRRYVLAALVTASNLLVIYIVKVVDVSDLADLFNRLSSTISGIRVSTGVGLWLGLSFALLTFLFLLGGLVFRWGIGEELTYPSFGAHESRRGTPPEPQNLEGPDHPPPPQEPPGSAPSSG